MPGDWLWGQWELSEHHLTLCLVKEKIEREYERKEKGENLNFSFTLMWRENRKDRNETHKKKFLSIFEEKTRAKEWFYSK